MIEVKWGHKVGPNLIGLVSLGKKGGDTRARALSLSAMWGHGKKEAVLKPGKELSPGIELASTLILDFWLPELWEINVCCWSHPVCGSLLWQLSKLRQWPTGRVVTERRLRVNSSRPPLFPLRGYSLPLQDCLTWSAYLQLETTERISPWTLPNPHFSAYLVLKSHATLLTL